MQRKKYIIDKNRKVKIEKLEWREKIHRIIMQNKEIWSQKREEQNKTEEIKIYDNDLIFLCMLVSITQQKWYIIAKCLLVQ